MTMPRPVMLAGSPHSTAGASGAGVRERLGAVSTQPVADGFMHEAQPNQEGSQ